MSNMENAVFVDEKWFHLSKINQKIYLLPCESDPHRTTQSKHSIPKAMFLAAVCRPRYNVTAKKMFDGKIGIWPFIEMLPAKRSSKNRPAGTILPMPVAITWEVYRTAIIEKIIPAIKNSWPGRKQFPIFIQKDNAKSHTLSSDKDVIKEGTEDGWNISTIN